MTLALQILAVLLALVSGSQALTLGTAEISWVNRGQKTEFQISSPLGNGVTGEAAWMGLGFNKEGAMVSFHS